MSDDIAKDSDLETETVVNLSFEDVFRRFKDRKFEHRKEYKRNPTVCFIGEMEMAVFSKNKAELQKRNVLKVKGGHPYILNMLLIPAHRQSCIAPAIMNKEWLDCGVHETYNI